MHRRRLVARSGALLFVPLAGCSSDNGDTASNGEDEPPVDPVVESVRRPDPVVPEWDEFYVSALPEDGSPVTERVENVGDAGDVHVLLTLLEADGDVYTGRTERARVIEMDAEESRDVTFEELPSGADAYRIEARPGSLVAAVTNEGGDGAGRVSLTADDGATIREERRVELAADETTDLTFTGFDVLASAADLDVEISPVEADQ